MAIIPLGALTIPSIRKLLISNPGLPGGRFSGDPPPPVSLPKSGAKGSRRERFSRTATGFRVGAVTVLGTSGLAAATGLAFGTLPAVFAAAAGAGALLGAATGLTLAAVAAAGFTSAVPPAGFAAEVVVGAGFAGGVAPGTAFGAGAVAGLAVAAEAAAGFAVGVLLLAGLAAAEEPLAGFPVADPAAEFGVATGAGLVAGAAGFVAEVAAVGAGFAAGTAGFGAEVAGEVGFAAAPAEPGFAVGVFDVAVPAGVA